ncbi:MAG: trypsin-like peptidase domain-containing protein [Acidimicrobiales bacterium]
MGALVAALAATSGGWYWSDGAADRRTSEVTAGLEATRRQVRALEERVRELEAVLEQPALPETAAAAKASVFTVTTAFGVGSGWVAKAGDGRSLLVTNHHVVEGAVEQGQGEVMVTQDGRSLVGRVAEVSPPDDLALVAVDQELPALPIAASDPRIGDAVIVVGSPLGLDQSVVTGIVSARRGDSLQLSAPLNPGNSGGPVLNEGGEVVGVVVRKAVQEPSEGLGFAIPVATVCAVLPAC